MAAGWRKVGLALLPWLALSSCNKAPKDQSNTTADTSTTAPVAVRDPTKLPAGVLDRETLNAYADAVHDFKPKDQFTKKFDDRPLIGREFHVSIPVSDNADNGVWAYDADKGELYLSLAPENKPETYVYFLGIERDRNVTNGQMMSNAFGATVEGSTTHERIVGIGSANSAYMGIFPKKNILKDYFEYGQLYKKITMTPEAARQATKDMTVEIDGKVVQRNPYEAVYCTTGSKDATIINPKREEWDICLISSKLSRLAFVSRSKGILAEFNSK